MQCTLAFVLCCAGKQQTNSVLYRNSRPIRGWILKGYFCGYPQCGEQKVVTAAVRGETNGCLQWPGKIQEVPRTLQASKNICTPLFMLALVQYLYVFKCISCVHRGVLCRDVPYQLLNPESLLNAHCEFKGAAAVGHLPAHSALALVGGKKRWPSSRNIECVGRS